MCRRYYVDMDKTLAEGVSWTPEEVLKAKPVKNVVDKVNELYQTGFIVIYTARQDHLIPATLEWLRRNNVMYHAISNLKIPGGTYIDDMAVNVKDIDEV